jgi:hypothetical protein
MHAQKAAGTHQTCSSKSRRASHLIIIRRRCFIAAAVAPTASHLHTHPRGSQPHGANKNKTKFAYFLSTLATSTNDQTPTRHHKNHTNPPEKKTQKSHRKQEKSFITIYY